MDGAAVGREGLLAQAERHSMGQGQNHGSQLPHSSVPALATPQGPCLSLQGLRGGGALTECFISSRCLKSNPWPSNLSPHLEMNPTWGHGCSGSGPTGTGITPDVTRVASRQPDKLVLPWAIGV